MESGAWRRLKVRVENKRHTNAHQPLTSHSATEASIPPSPPDLFIPHIFMYFHHVKLAGYCPGVANGRKLDGLDRRASRF
jgi:hypothetical protein